MCAKEKEAMYALAPNEELIFELNIDEVSLKEESEGGAIGALLNSLLEGVTNMVKSIFPCLCKKPGEGVFVVTNSRCMIVYREKVRGLFGFNKHEERRFWTFPRRAITERHSYAKSAHTSCWCCSSQNFVITIGLDSDEVDISEFTICSHDITSDLEAQSLISTLIELSQNS